MQDAAIGSPVSWLAQKIQLQGSWLAVLGVEGKPQTGRPELEKKQDKSWKNKNECRWARAGGTKRGRPPWWPHVECTGCLSARARGPQRPVLRRMTKKPRHPQGFGWRPAGACCLPSPAGGSSELSGSQGVVGEGGSPHKGRVWVREGRACAAPWGRASLEKRLHFDSFPLASFSCLWLPLVFPVMLLIALMKS